MKRLALLALLLVSMKVSGVDRFSTPESIKFEITKTSLSNNEHTMDSYISFLEKHTGKMKCYTTESSRLSEHNLLVLENDQFIIEIPYHYDKDIPVSLYELSMDDRELPSSLKSENLKTNSFIVVDKATMENVPLTRIEDWMKNPDSLELDLKRSGDQVKRRDTLYAFELGKFNREISDRIFGTLRTQLILNDPVYKNLNDLLEALHSILIGHLVFHIEMIDYGVYSARIMISDYARDVPVDVYIYVPFIVNEINYEKCDFRITAESSDVFIDVYFGGKRNYKVKSVDVKGLIEMINNRMI